jgi:hypothetical protein
VKRCAAALLLLVSSSAAAETFDLRGFATARGLYVTGQPSWTRGGFGRFDKNNAGLAEIQLGADWRPFAHLLLHAHGVARSGPSGLVTAYAETSFERGRSELQLRAGEFFLGTSRENTADLWSSPYTISFSALNTWIAQEVRPIGVNAEWRVLTSTALITTAATVFRGNDSMGALLAWRGWTIGNRLSVYDEVLPLPPIESLRTVFIKQRTDGTVPFEADLDKRTGYATRIRYALPERFNVQYTHLDNRGDRQLHRGEYAWATRFDDIGAELHARKATLLAEWMAGRTGMGPKPVGVDAGFYAAYALASLDGGRNRFSARFEVFATIDRRLIETEKYGEHGKAWTFSWLFAVTPKIRTGAEFTQIVGTHDEAETAGLEPTIDGRSVTVEVRYSFK